jgi:diadenosine tetraphosphate (Ap4A) HIT family hydrolase
MSAARERGSAYALVDTAFHSVPHFHLHLIPRWMDDGKGFTWELEPGSPTRIRQMTAAIRAAL